MARSKQSAKKSTKKTEVSEPAPEVKPTSTKAEKPKGKAKVEKTKGKKEQAEPKNRGQRRKVTIESHLEKYDELLTLLNNHIEQMRKNKESGSRVFTTIRKSVKDLQKEVPKIANTRRSVNPNSKNNKISGFGLECELSPELTKFLQVDSGTTLCRKDVTNAICVYAHLNENENRDYMLKWSYLNPDGKRNLQNPKDKMAVLPDAALSKLLNYEQYKKDVKNGKIYKNVKNKKTKVVSRVKVDNPALYYWVIQRLLGVHYTATIRRTAETTNSTSTSEVEILA